MSRFRRTAAVGRSKSIFTLLTVTAIVAGTLLAMPVLAGLGLGLALTAFSQRTVFQRAVSPGGWREARVQFDDCGAACVFRRVVFIKYRPLPDQPMFSCNAFQVRGEWPMRVRWLDGRTLLVANPAPASEIEWAAKSCGPVRIEVHPAPSS